MKKQGFFSRLLTKAMTNMVHAGQAIWRWMLPRTHYDYEREVGQGDRSSVIMAPLFWIARRLAEAKYMMLDKDGEKLDDHDMLRLLNKPNPFYSGRALRMASAISYNTDGNVYWLKIRNKQLKVIQLWYIPHWLMEPHWPDDGLEYIDYYRYQPGTEPIQIMPEDVVHIRNGIDSFNIRKGMAPLKSLFREIFTDDQAANFTASLLRNMGIPGIIISPGSDNVTVAEDDKQAVKMAFKSKFGDDNTGDPLVMTAKTEIKQFGFSPQAMDLGNIRNIPEERVCAILGVAAAVVGFGTGLQQTKVGATMKEMRESSYEDCIIPMQNSMADELDLQLLPEFEESPNDFKLDFDLSNIRILQEDETARVDRITKLVTGGILMHCEGRKELGYNAHPESDDEDDVYFIPNAVTVTPASEFAKPKPKAPAPIFVPGGMTPPSSTDNSVDPNNQATNTDSGKSAKESQTKSWKTKLVKEFDRSCAHQQKLFAASLKKQFKALGEKCSEAWRRTAENRGITTLSADKPQTKDPQTEYYADLITGEVKTDILDYGAQYMRVAVETYSIIDAVTTLMVNLSDPAQQRILNEGGTRKGLIDMKAQTRQAIFDALTEAREYGLGADATARLIADKVEAGPWASVETRSQCIARTETKNAQNVSSIEAYKSGGVERVEIVDGQLPTSDEFCISRNGEIIPIDQAMGLDEHPNGTLSFTPVIDLPGGENAA